MTHAVCGKRSGAYCVDQRKPCALHLGGLDGVQTPCSVAHSVFGDVFTVPSIDGSTATAQMKDPRRRPPDQLLVTVRLSAARRGSSLAGSRRSSPPSFGCWRAKSGPLQHEPAPAVADEPPTDVRSRDLDRRLAVHLLPRGRGDRDQLLVPGDLLDEHLGPCVPHG